MLATTIHESNTTPHHQAGQQQTVRPTTNTPHGARACCLRTQQCVWQSPCRRYHPQRDARDRTAFVICAPDPHPLQVWGHPTNRPGHRTPTRCGRAM